MKVTKSYHVLALLSLLTLFAIPLSANRTAIKSQEPTTNNWAVLVSSSRYWFNYRHATNVLSIYRQIRRLGIDDSHIILMLADDMACDARNPWPATIFNNAKHNPEQEVYGNDVEVDYRGDEVTTETFLKLLTGRHEEGTPKSKKLLTDERSNILIYLTGHGGNGFLKFQDKLELTSVELADAFEQMHQKKRYNEILFVVDTCQAESMSLDIRSPNIIGIGSSKIGEDSYSHSGDSSIGVYVIDRFSYHVLKYLEQLDSFSSASKRKLTDLFRVCPQSVCGSTVKVRQDLYSKKPHQVPITDFFGHESKFNLINIADETLGWESML